MLVTKHVSVSEFVLKLTSIKYTLFKHINDTQNIYTYSKIFVQSNIKHSKLICTQH